jgi:hypothetical protein
MAPPSKEEQLASYTKMQASFQAQIVKANTSDGYWSKSVLFVCFLHIFHPDKVNACVTGRLAAANVVAYPPTAGQKKVIKAALKDLYAAWQKTKTPDLLPLRFDAVTADDLELYFSSLDPDHKLGKGSFDGARSAVRDFFVHKYGQPWEAKYGEQLKSAFKGIKHTVAARDAASGKKTTVGKNPLPYPVYKAIARGLLSEGTHASLFALAYLTLSWNLCCRSSNTCSVSDLRVMRTPPAHTLAHALSPTPRTPAAAPRPPRFL